MPEPEVIRVVKEFQLELSRSEADAMRKMAANWLRVESALESYIKKLTDEMEAKRAAGIAVGDSYQLERYKELLAATRAEMGKYSEWAGSEIRRRQEKSARLGAEQAAAELAQVGGSFVQLNPEASSAMVALTQEEAPVMNLLRDSWGDAAVGMTDALNNAIAMGWGPAKTAAAMKEGLANGLQRIMTIARTEQLRAYRMGTQKQYEDSGIVDEWIWVCAKSDRTCLACLLLDGSRHSSREIQQDHPNGRCTSIPVVRGREDMVPDWQKGKEWLLSQPASKQKEIMGKGLFELWDGGRGFPLMEALKIVHNSIWGDSPSIRSLQSLRVTFAPPAAPAAQAQAIPRKQTFSAEEVESWDYRMGHTPILERGKPDSIEAIPSPGINPSVKIKWKSGEAACWKPYFDTQAVHEVRAANVARALGYNAVPEVQYMELPSYPGDVKVGTAMDWANDAHTALAAMGGSTSAKVDLSDPVIVSQKSRLDLFDLIVQNKDRHPGNWMIGDSAPHKVYAIDHGFTFVGKISSKEEEVKRDLHTILVNSYNKEAAEKELKATIDEWERVPVEKLEAAVTDDPAMWRPIDIWEADRAKDWARETHEFLRLAKKIFPEVAKNIREEWK